MLAAALMSVMAALIKLAGQNLQVTQILLVRQIVVTALAVPAIMRGWPGSIRTARPGMQVARGFIGFTAMVLGFSAIIHLPLAEATVIAFSRSFFITLLAIAFLGEIVGLPRWLGLAAGFSGVLIIVWPESGAAPGIWHLAALASALCVSVLFIMLRILARVDQPVTVLAYQSFGVGLLLIPPAIWFWRAPDPWEWVLLAAIGGFCAAGQILNILAMRVGEASALAPLDYTRLIFATALGFWLFSEWPTSRVWIGSVVIVAAAAFVLLRERHAVRRRRRQGGL